MTKEKILKIASEERIEFVRLSFTDIFGMQKSIDITAGQLAKVLEKGCTFDGSSIQGFARVEESDMLLVPDLDSFCIMPVAKEPGRMARLICNVYTTDGVPFAGDPRYVLRRAIDDAASMGYSVDIGPECEFFLFNIDDNGKPDLKLTDPCGYFDVAPLDYGEKCRRAICLALETIGFSIEAIHHENASSQHEIDFRYCEAMEAADKIMTLKQVVKSVAIENKLYATFIPKPLFGFAGSGMHINISLSRDGKNIMYGDKIGNLSEEAIWFVGGLLKHAKGFCAVTNPLVNSYKRLTSGFEAPTNIAWSLRNRSPLVRIPSFEEENARIELRNPDPSCNPYLAFAAVIEAGLDGIRNRIMPPEITDGNIFELSGEEKEQVGIESLPGNLYEALGELKKDECIMNTLGDVVSSTFIFEKNREWQAYSYEVSSWEIENYLTKY